MRALTGTIESYDAPSTEEIAQRVGLRPDEIIRFDGNTSPQALPSTRAEAMTEALGRIHTYPHGGYPELERAIANYAGVAPENIVLGAGADDLILLLTRSFASPGDRVAIANDPTYPMFPISVWVAGAEIGDDSPVLTICCRPNNPTGELGELPAARPLVVDEAYFEYARASAVDLIEDGVVVIRTFSKAFDPLPSEANFLYVPVDDPRGDYDRLLAQGMAVRPVRGGIRLTIRTEKDDERLLHALGSLRGV
jgi:histidinol-phosphate/aromatic aminotransferase/cobyric acid decarboxylase-like protein